MITINYSSLRSCICVVHLVFVRIIIMYSKASRTDETLILYLKLSVTHTQPFFQDYPGVPVPER